MPDCPRCGTAVARETRYCPECGRPLAASDGAAPAPPLVRRWPPDPFVLIAALLVLGGAALALAREWAWGTAAALAGLVVFLAREDLERRRAAWAFRDLRGRAAATREAVAARSREQIDLFRARRELAELESERDRLFRELGASVHAGDETGTNAARTALAPVLERLAAKEAEIEELRRGAEERVARAQANVRPTQKLGED